MDRRDEEWDAYVLHRCGNVVCVRHYVRATIQHLVAYVGEFGHTVIDL